MTTAPPYALMDAYLEGGIEERAWVPVAHVSAAADVVAWLHKHESWLTETIDDDMELVATGERSWHRTATCGDCDGDGGEPYEPRPRPACETCEGTGREQDHGEGQAWEPCEPTDPGAVEFWDVELRPQAVRS